MEKVIINTKAAPEATGHYSQAIMAGDFIFTSGQLGLVPETGEMLTGIEEQTRQALVNTENVLKAAGMDRRNIVKVNIFVEDLDAFPVVDALYADFWKAPASPLQRAGGKAVPRQPDRNRGGRRAVKKNSIINTL